MLLTKQEALNSISSIYRKKTISKLKFIQFNNIIVHKVFILGYKVVWSGLCLSLVHRRTPKCNKCMNSISDCSQHWCFDIPKCQWHQIKFISQEESICFWLFSVGSILMMTYHVLCWLIYFFLTLIYRVAPCVWLSCHSHINFLLKWQLKLITCM